MQDLGDGRGQRRLSMVDVTDGADVDVRLGPLEFRLRHGIVFLLGRYYGMQYFSVCKSLFGAIRLAGYLGEATLRAALAMISLATTSAGTSA